MVQLKKETDTQQLVEKWKNDSLQHTKLDRQIHMNNTLACSLLSHMILKTRDQRQRLYPGS